jgi:membrane-anchored protein YejM (alkaline phosphatase superfamily)
MILENRGTLETDTMVIILEDHGIDLSDSDRQFLKRKLEDKGSVNYEEVIKELLLIISPSH